MFKSFMDRLLSLFFRSGRSRRLVFALIFFLGILPVIGMGVDNYFATQRHFNETLQTSHSAIAHLAAVNLREKFSHFKDLSLSVVHRPLLKTSVQKGDWEAAIQSLQDVPLNFPIVENVFLADPEGNYWSSFPLLPGISPGANYAYRDWYKGVMASGEPYVSEVFIRAPIPHYQVFTITTPIRDDDQKIIGIFAMIIRLESVLAWTHDVNVGQSGFVYFVDRNGTVVGHPDYLFQEDLVDFSSVPVVQKALRGEKGVEITYNPVDQEERISAYEPLPEYGWAVVAQQPTAVAFASRQKELRQLFLSSGITIFFSALLIYMILRLLGTMSQYRQREAIFLESIGDGLVAIDRFWNITLWNHTASVMTGFSKEEVLGNPFRSIVRFISEKTRKENIVFIENTMLEGKPHQMENHTLLLRKDGTELPVADSCAPIFDSKGKVSGAIIIFRDVTVEREVEQNREEFMSLATHQLRTPVTAIKWSSEMLLGKKSDPLTPRQQEAVESIQGANNRMLDLVNGMLNVCRIETGTLAIDPEPVFLPDIADAVIQELETQSKPKSLKVTKKYAEDMGSVSADPKLTHAIFQNLLSNAIRYTPSGGTITLSIEKQKFEFLVKVQDTGIGIPKAQQNKIFTKLFRAENAIKTVESGTGLGLYIIKRILDQAGGKIWFESKEGKGTAFFVTLPLEGMKKMEGTKGLS